MTDCFVDASKGKEKKRKKERRTKCIQNNSANNDQPGQVNKLNERLCKLQN